MKKKYILIMMIDHQSINEEIILKSLKKIKNSKNNFLFIGDSYFFKKIKKKIFVTNNISTDILKKKIIFYDLSSKKMSNFKYINKITDFSINLLKKKIAHLIINMPINKKKYFKNKYPGFTEFLAKKLNQENQENMLLFNDKFSVSPVTTHIKVSDISKNITRKKIEKTVINVNNFYKKIIKKKVKIKILGLNPHSGIDFDSSSEEKRIILPAIKKLKKSFNNIEGPISADTCFFNKEKSSTIGMYHDQILPVFKSLVMFDGINITIGLKYLRLSPDHGVGSGSLLKKRENINNRSFLYCLKFCEKYI